MERKMPEILKDALTLEQFHKMQYAVSCEDCTHFDFDNGLCTFTFPVEPFLRRNQMRDLETKGEMAFCRSMEID